FCVASVLGSSCTTCTLRSCAPYAPINSSKYLCFERSLIMFPHVRHTIFCTIEIMPVIYITYFMRKVKKNILYFLQKLTISLPFCNMLLSCLKD
ncbi:MAG: hypothetical protein LBJ16_01345, partial [Holosporaceae bacterium]|nr:hypothetical protein [Holosporaceae bacterium]